MIIVIQRSIVRGEDDPWAAAHTPNRARRPRVHVVSGEHAPAGGGGGPMLAAALAVGGGLRSEVDPLQAPISQEGVNSLYRSWWEQATGAPHPSVRATA